MTTKQDLDYESVLKIVQGWPVARRFALLHELLKTLELDATAPRVKPPTLDHALGLAVTDRPAPSDAEVKQWLEEERVKKYG